MAVKSKTALVKELIGLLAEGLTGNAATFITNVKDTYESMETAQAGSGDKLLYDLCSAKTKSISIIKNNTDI